MPGTSSASTRGIRLDSARVRMPRCSSSRRSSHVGTASPRKIVEEEAAMYGSGMRPGSVVVVRVGSTGVTVDV